MIPLILAIVLTLGDVAFVRPPSVSEEVGEVNSHVALVWRMESDGSSNEADEIDGAALVVSPSDTIPTTNGLLSLARDFELSDQDYMTLAGNSKIALSDGKESFSVVSWFKAESVSASFNALVDSRNAAGTNGFSIYRQNSDGLWRFALHGTNSTTVAWSTSFSDTSSWHMIAAVYDGAADLIKLSLDGGTFTTASHTGGTRLGAGELLVSKFSTSAVYYWDGLIDNIFFFDVALTQDQVGLLYNSGTGEDYPLGF